ncbi:hypothetical protein Tco_0632650 [Tanacetum coccineum]
MNSKDTIRAQTCKLTKEEFTQFLSLYPIPSEYHVMLPKRNQTIFDALDGYVRLNTFSCAKLTTFIVMCKAYGCEPSLDLFRGLFNSFHGGKWLTFAKRVEKHIPNHLPKDITRIKGWKGRFFFVQDSVVLANFHELLSKDNRWDTKSFRDKLPDNIHENPSFQRLGRYPTSRPTIIVDGKEMAFRNFMYAKADDDLTFIPKEPSLEFGTRSPSISINTEPPITKAVPTGQLVENTTDSGDSPCLEKLMIHPSSVATRIREIKCRTRGGSSKPHVKHKLVQGASSSRSPHAKVAASKDDSPFLTISDDDKGLPDVLELQNANTCHLQIFAITPLAWKNYLDNQLDVDLLDLHDRCYARQTVVENAVNRKSRELLKMINQIKAECDVLKDREKSRDQECEELKAKCEAAMAYFDKNPAVNVLCEKIASFSGEVKEHRANLDRMLLESQKWAGYQVSLSTLESKVASLEAGKVKLEVIEASLRQELQNAKLDRAEVVSKVVPFVTMKFVNSDDIGRLVAKLVSASILYRRCQAFEEVAKIKEPFDITKVKGYMSSYKKEHTRAGNELATTTFPFLAEVITDPHAFVEALLSKKPHVLQRPTSIRTHMPASSTPSQKATPLPAPMSPPSQITPA